MHLDVALKIQLPPQTESPADTLSQNLRFQNCIFKSGPQEIPTHSKTQWVHSSLIITDVLHKRSLSIFQILPTSASVYKASYSATFVQILKTLQFSTEFNKNFQRSIMCQVLGTFKTLSCAQRTTVHKKIHHLVCEQYTQD